MSIQNDKIISISVSTVTISVIFDNIETNGGVIMAVANNIKRFRKMNNLYQKELAACRRICRQGGLVRPCHVAGMGGACADFRAGRADMVPVYCG